MKILRFPFWILLLIKLFTMQYLIAQKHSLPDSILNRYAATHTKNAQGNRFAPWGYLVKFHKYPGESFIQQKGFIKAISRLHYILQTGAFDTTEVRHVVYCYPANANWKASVAVLDQLNKLQTSDSVLLQINTDSSFFDINQPQLFRIREWRPQYNTAIVMVKKTDWPAFIEQSGIRFADLIQKAIPEAVIITNNLYLNRIKALQQKHPGIQGTGIVVSLKEDLLNPTDLDLTGRYLPSYLASATISAHATTMATIIGGAGNSSPSGLGVSPKIKFSAANFDNGFLPAEDSYYQKYGISIQNHSYGTKIESYYGTEAAAFDKQIFEADTLVHVFSSGNSGDQMATEGIYSGISGFSNLTGNYKQAKNVIVLGGTDETGQIIPLSSNGPAFDGRVKPEIVAYGQNGTSGAAAITSGVVGLLQEAYRHQHGQSPSASLIKAILINSAHASAQFPVSFRSGFGNLRASEAINTLYERRYKSGIVSAWHTNYLEIEIPPAIHQLKVTLCWNDPPANVNTTKALINDLDLSLTDTNGHLYLPWTLSAYPMADSLWLLPKRGIDSINNVEQVTIDHPLPGKMRIQINGKNIRTGSQAFHLAYQWIPADTFEWQNPMGKIVALTGQPFPLQWQTTLTGKGDISYSLDEGVTWTSIARNIPLERGGYNWKTPEVFAEAIVKMSTGDTVIISSPLLISGLLDVKIGFDCNDTTFVYWQPQKNATSYQVYIMGDENMLPYRQVVDTFLLIPKKYLTTEYISVSPISPKGWEGTRSYAFNYSAQGMDCYFRNLWATIASDDKVVVTLVLGTTYKIRNISLERLSQNNFIQISAIPATLQTSYTFEDKNMSPGITFYRVRLETEDNAVLYSKPVSVNVLLNKQHMIFPNPVSNTLYILSKVPDIRELIISDFSGRRVMQQTITNTNESIPVQQLVNGVYNCTILKDGKKVFNDKFVKQ